MTKDYLKIRATYKRLMPKLYDKFAEANKARKIKYARSILNRIKFLAGVLEQLNASSGGTEFLPYKQ